MDSTNNHPSTIALLACLALAVMLIVTLAPTQISEGEETYEVTLYKYGSFHLESGGSELAPTGNGVYSVAPGTVVEVVCEGSVDKNEVTEIIIDGNKITGDTVTINSNMSIFPI